MISELGSGSGMATKGLVQTTCLQIPLFLGQTSLPTFTIHAALKKGAIKDLTEIDNYHGVNGGIHESGLG